MKSQKLFCVLFFVVLGLFAVLTVCLPATEFSPNENRNLAQFPELTVDTLLSGEFQSGLADFLSDQIPGREFWIRANTGIKKWLGKTEINGVYFGDDGYYFQQFTEESYDPARKAAIFSLLNQFAGKTDAKVNILMVPTPAAVLSGKLPANAPMYDADAMWESLKAATPNCGFIDLRPSFAAANEQLYYRTDHHWTNAGAYLAYTEFCKAMGLEAKPMEAFGVQQVSDSFLGTIYSKTLDGGAQPEAIHAPQELPKLTVTFDGGKTADSIYAEDFLAKKDQYAYFFGGNWGRVDIDTGVDNGKSIVIIKDSFANSFVPYLLGEYAHITMLDLRYFAGNVQQTVADTGADEVLFLYEMTNLLTDTGILKLAR